MSDSTPTPGLPPWVRKRDGRVVPFDPDAIGQDLFAAAEALGKGDAFLAHELTDGVLHFLAADCTESTPDTGWISELVIKVVRELRQPRLAQAFSERLGSATAAKPPVRISTNPAEIARQGLQAYSLENVFSRDLAAAHRDGLVTLHGLDSPRELAAALLSPPGPAAPLQALQVLDAVLELRGGVADWLAIDGAEHMELEKGSPPLPRLLGPFLQAAGLVARLQLNCADPPPWAAQAGHGPLFGDQTHQCDSLDAASIVMQGVLALQRERCPFAIDWHVSEADFAHVAENGLRGDLLEAMARAALGEYPITFVFDRPKRPITLGPGLDRLHSYLLMSVDLHLPRFLEHTGITDDAELFQRKLASLARLAVSAAVQKRAYLRETLHEAGPDRAFLQRGFLLDRARLMVRPRGLNEAVRALAGAGLHEAKPALDLGRTILQRLCEVLAEEGKQRLVECVVDSSGALSSTGGPAPAKQHLTAAGRLQVVCGSGTAIAALNEDERLSVDQVVRLLEYTWRQTEVVRLQFQPRPAAERQPTLLA